MTEMKLTVRTPADLIALTPLVLGFHPDDSIVLLSFGSQEGSFHARVDMPVEFDQCAEVVDLLATPLARHRPRTVAVLIFSDDEALTQDLAERLVPAVLALEVGLIEVLRVEESAYAHPLEPELGMIDYDVSEHPFVAQGVLHGRRTWRDRDEVSGQLVGADPDELDEVSGAIQRHLAQAQTQVAQGRWLQEWTRRQRRTRADIALDDVARFAAAVADAELRDVVWHEIRRDTAVGFVEMLVVLTRRTPGEHVAPVAGLLGFAAWQAGDGALAWSAVEHCLEHDPDHGLAHLVAQTLRNAMSPRSWVGLREEELAVLRAMEQAS